VTAMNVEIVTSKGTVKLELYPDQAPETVKNFLEYVDAKHYDGTIFHRVIADFMIQGGGYDGSLVKKPVRAPVQNESKNGLKNLRGTIAMARTSDPHSATCQFFINTKDNASLDSKNENHFGYSVFGLVTAGMDVVSAIEHVDTGEKNGMRDVPTEDVVIESVRRVD
jgi:peptidyl-prolyl cis-trans isomerase A (cyclophilin A)